MNDSNSEVADLSADQLHELRKLVDQCEKDIAAFTGSKSGLGLFEEALPLSQLEKGLRMVGLGARARLLRSTDLHFSLSKAIPEEDRIEYRRSNAEGESDTIRRSLEQVPKKERSEAPITTAVPTRRDPPSSGHRHTYKGATRGDAEFRRESEEADRLSAAKLEAETREHRRQAELTDESERERRRREEHALAQARLHAEQMQAIQRERAAQQAAAAAAEAERQRNAAAAAAAADRERNRSRW